MFLPISKLTNPSALIHIDYDRLRYQSSTEFGTYTKTNRSAIFMIKVKCGSWIENEKKEKKSIKAKKTRIEEKFEVWIILAHLWECVCAPIEWLRRYSIWLVWCDDERIAIHLIGTIYFFDSNTQRCGVVRLRRTCSSTHWTSTRFSSAFKVFDYCPDRVALINMVAKRPVWIHRSNFALQPVFHSIYNYYFLGLPELRTFLFRPRALAHWNHFRTVFVIENRTKFRRLPINRRRTQCVIIYIIVRRHRRWGRRTMASRRPHHPHIVHTCSCNRAVLRNLPPIRLQRMYRCKMLHFTPSEHRSLHRQ